MPQTIMLAVHCKKSETVDLKAPIVKFVAGSYGPQASTDVASDLDEVAQLRADCINQTGPLSMQAANLAKYYRWLTLMESRFPISRNPEHASIEFAWSDAFRPQKRAEQSSIHFEKAAIVFNLGAVQSQLALQCDRKTDSGLKDSSRLFQEAAGTFGFLRDSASLKIDQPRPLDLTPEAAAMLEKLMLAQAQECVLEKAISDKKAPGVVARVAKQAAVYYRECSSLLSHFDRSWLAHASVKALLYDVEATVQNSASLRDADQFAGVAKEIARLRASQVVLAQAKTEARNASKELQDNVVWKEQWIATRLQKAERDNNTVYLQRIPADVDLPPIVAASLVKPSPPTALKPTSEEQGSMFTSVVPDNSAKALSKYSDMVDTLIRTQMHKLNGASDDARIRLREWELPEALHALEAGTVAALPDGVRVELEAIQEGGGLQHLQEVQAQVKELRAACLDELDKIESDLQQEEREDNDLRQHYGQRWRRPPSAQLTKNMVDKLAGYRSNLMQAGESDKQLEMKLVSEAAAFAALDPEAAATQMPKMQAPMLSVENMEPATAVATLRQALEGLNTLSGQRAALEEALKERKNRDNVLPMLLGGGGSSPDELFQSELKKYDDLVMEVDNNVSKSQQLLDVIAANQSIFKSSYGFPEWRRACEGAASGVKASIKMYKELRDNLGEGLRFYMGLQEAIGSLRQQAGDHCMTRRIQRDDVIDDLRKQAAEEADRTAAQMAALNLQKQQAAAPPPPPPVPQAVGGAGGASYGGGYAASPGMSGGYENGPAPMAAASSGSYGSAPPPPHHQQQQPGYGPPAPPHQQQAQAGFYSQPQYQPPQYQQQQYPPVQYSQSYGAPPQGYGPPPPPMQQAYSGGSQGGYSYAPPQPGPQQGQYGQQAPPPPPHQPGPQGHPSALQPPPPHTSQQPGNPIGQFFNSVFR
ncbi:Vacuolar-sorting protein [Chlorella vulgaris]